MFMTRLGERSRRRGSTLILVLIVGVLFALLAFATAGVAVRGSGESILERDKSDLTYRCEAAAEALRLQVVNHQRLSAFASGAWMTRLRADWQYYTAPGGGSPTADWPSGPVPGSPAPGGGAITLAALPGVRAWIDRVGTAAEGQWIEIVGATINAGGSAADQRAPVSVRMRLNIGNNEIFDLVFLTVTTNCMFCHFHVKGDVGSIGFFRPGWGTENSNGQNSGNGSNVAGNIYLADKASDDAEPSGSGTGQRGNNIWEPLGADGVAGTGDDQPTINGVTRNTPTPGPDGIWGNGDDTTVQGSVTEFYAGPKLPEDTIGNDGIPDFPSFDPAKVSAQATAEGGGIYAGPASGTGVAYDPANPNNAGAWVVPTGGDWNNGAGATPLNRTSSSSVINGNLVLVGTAANPIELNGNVFVTGDIIVKGPIKAGTQGALYAGRNIYVTGDIKYQDAPTAGYPIKDDAQGAAAVGEHLSELRLAARSNVVIGDWSYEDGSGNLDRVRNRQGEDFMYSQFSLGNTRFYHVDAANNVLSNEVVWDAAANGGSGGYVNDLGQVVPTNEVAKVSNPIPSDPNGYTVTTKTSTSGLSSMNPLRYDSSMAPGSVEITSNGSSSSHGEKRGSFNPWMSQGEYQNLLGQGQYDYIGYRIPNANTAAKRAFEYGADWVAANGDYPNAGGQGKFDKDILTGASGPGSAGMYIRHHGGTIKFAEVSNSPGNGSQKVLFKRQVTHIDAFIFANKRIGGMSNLGHITINGGMAAREIGVLAPGFQNNTGWGGPNAGGDAFMGWVGNMLNPNHSSHPKNAYGDKWQKTRLYYDYRLRNGGFGFEFLAKTGDVTFYQRQGRRIPVTTVNGGSF